MLELEEVWLCNNCGATTYRVGEDAIDYCLECGVMEGNTHVMREDEDV